MTLLMPVVLFVSMNAGTLHAADKPDEQFTMTGQSSSTAVGVHFTDGLFTQIASYLEATSLVKGSNGAATTTETQDLCASPDDVICHAGKSGAYLAHLPRCEIPTQLDCVDSIYAIRADGTRVMGTFVSNMPEAVVNPYLGNVSLGIPTPGPDGIWKLPGVINGSGDETYAVSAILSGMFTKSPDTSLKDPVSIYEFDAGIFPVKLISGTYTPSHVEAITRGGGGKSLAYYAAGGVGSESCITTTINQCALHEAFPMDTRFGLSLRLSGEIKGWLHGRLRDPEITYQSSSSGTSLAIEALPTRVPIVDAWTDRANLPATIPGTFNGDISLGTSIMAWPWGDAMSQLLRMWLPIIKDTAQATPSEWIVRNLSSPEMSGTFGCMAGSNGLAGVVTTNSTVYTAGPPRFNSNTQSLDYTLVSPHFTNKGEVFKGVYTLAIRSDVARCLYHFTNAPIKATISITDDSGTSSVAVESMAEHDGWIYLSASNFEFSSPTVHIKLTQDALVVPVITPSPTPSTSLTPPVSTSVKRQTPKKITISCVKGFLLKRVSAVKPVCPKGYKKMPA